MHTQSPGRSARSCCDWEGWEGQTLKAWNECVVLTGAKGAGKLSINNLTSGLVRGRHKAGDSGVPGGSEDWGEGEWK